MKKTNDLFNEEVLKNNKINALDDIYTINARVLPPGDNIVQGRDAIKSFWQQAIARLGLRSATLTTLDAEVLEDRVFEIGYAGLTVNDNQSVSVKYVVQWKQEDGNWKWHLNIWNANQ